MTTPHRPAKAEEIARKCATLIQADCLGNFGHSDEFNKKDASARILAAITEATAEQAKELAELRAENERLKGDSAAIAENDPFNPKTGQAIADMVNAFLSWPLPDSVCSDRCVMTAGAKHRSGTNLMTVTETMQMVQEVVCPIITKYMKADAAMSNAEGAK